MEKLSQDQARKDQNTNRRRMVMDKIRTSLQTIPLVRKNQDLVRSRIKSEISEASEEQDTDASNREIK